MLKPIKIELRYIWQQNWQSHPRVKLEKYATVLYTQFIDILYIVRRFVFLFWTTNLFTADKNQCTVFLLLFQLVLNDGGRNFLTQEQYLKHSGDKSCWENVKLLRCLHFVGYKIYCRRLQHKLQNVRLSMFYVATCYKRLRRSEDVNQHIFTWAKMKLVR